MTAVSHFAVWPGRAEDVTTESILRYLTVQAAAAQAKVTALRPAAVERRATAEARRAYNEATAAFGDAFGVVFILRQLPADWADAMARRLWECWDDGVEMSRLLHGWLAEQSAARQSRDEAPEPEKATSGTETT
jgi:hypothetical protein